MVKGQGFTVSKYSRFFGGGFSRLGVIVAGLVLFCLSAQSFGGLLLDLKPAPVSPLHKELRWTGAALFSDIGSVGNGDGLLPVDQQVPGGLRLQTPLYIPGVPGSSHNAADQSTTFYDVTLTLSGWSAIGPASATVVGGITVLSQLVGPIVGGGPATFRLDSTPAGGGPVELLSGHIDSAIIVGIEGGDTASVQSTAVRYTSGVIYNQLVALGLGTEGSLSWSLLDIDNFRMPPAGGPLMAFQADMTGLYNVIPEPGLCGLLALAGLLAGRRRAPAA